MLNVMLKLLSACFYLIFFGPLVAVFSDVRTPSNLLRNNRQDVVFMWNNTNGSILSVAWGLLDSNGDIKPEFIYISTRTNGPVFRPDLDTTAVRYKGRVSWVGNLNAGHAWFKITNLTVQDTNTYVAGIRKQGQSGTSNYNTSLTVAAIPSFPHFPTSPYLVKAIEGRNLVIDCTAIGPPTPTVQWFTSDGKEITSASVTGTVTLTKTNVKRGHNGTQYKCVASNNPNNDPFSTMIQVVVLYPPSTTIAPPSLTVVQDNVISLSCTADGYPPPSISWTKADGVIKAGHTVAGGTLAIPDAIKTDAGKYICTAKNTYDRREHIDNATATVTVEYQPTIILDSLLNQTVNNTDSLSMKCNADGNPPPTIKWKTPTGSVYTGNIYNILSVSRSHAGTYTCTASNGIGRDAMSSIQVTVQYKPAIDLSKSSLTFKSWNNNSIHLRCFATGLPAPRISWYKPTNQQITTGVNIVPEGSEVTVLTTADQGDYGQYKCRATNILGSDEHAIDVTQLFPPNCSSFAMTEGDIEASSITVRWNKPSYDGGSPVTGYKVQINMTEKKDTSDSDTNVKFSGLKKNTNYQVEVFAKNIAGYGRPCIKIVTTKKLGKPAVPGLTVTLVKAAELSVRLTWKTPDSNGKEINKYTIYMKENTSGEFAKMDDVDPAVLEYTVTKNMEYGKIYKFVVTAWNTLGESEYDDTMVKSITMPKKGSDPNKGKRTTNVDGESNAAVIPGVVGAVLFMLLVGIILGIIIIRKKGLLSNGFRRKSPSNRAAYDNDVDPDSANQQAAAAGLGGEDDGAPTYAAVDMSKKKKKNDIPDYAVVDKTKKKRPGEIIYAELADFNTAGSSSSAAAPRPIAYTSTDYADITQFQQQEEPEPTYANFPGRGKKYTDIQGM